MKIYSWNMLFRNREQDRAFSFIKENDFDVFCLQEVPEEFLRRLQTLPYSIAYRIDVERLLRKRAVHNYVVILSKHPIEQKGDIPFPDYWPFLPLRTRLFVFLMPSFLFTKIRNRGAMFADIRVPHASGVVRIFNLHLILAHPAWRMKEFELAMSHHNTSRSSIVCGDFNIVQSPRVSILNWILGGPTSDALLYNRERTRIEKRFVEHKLVNPLSGGITHPLSRSQLDHILVSHSLSIKNTKIFHDRIGSDHAPILVEIA